MWELVEEYNDDSGDGDGARVVIFQPLFLDDDDVVELAMQVMVQMVVEVVEAVPNT